MGNFSVPTAPRWWGLGNPLVFDGALAPPTTFVTRGMVVVAFVRVGLGAGWGGSAVGVVSYSCSSVLENTSSTMTSSKAA